MLRIRRESKKRENHRVRGRVQTIFGKINVIMTLRGGGGGGGSLFFVCVLLSFCSTITPRFCCNYANYRARGILLRS